MLVEPEPVDRNAQSQREGQGREREDEDMNAPIHIFILRPNRWKVKKFLYPRRYSGRQLTSDPKADDLVANLGSNIRSCSPWPTMISPRDFPLTFGPFDGIYFPELAEETD